MAVRAFWTYSAAVDSLLPQDLSQILASLASMERGGLALIGSGGKTTFLHLLAEGLARRALPSGHPARVWAGTSTHLGADAGFITDEATAASALDRQPAGMPLYAAARTGRDYQLGAFTEAESIRLADLADYSIIEADGSRRLPVKWPNATEPVLYPFLDTVLLLVGLAALGQPLCSVCQRVELAAPALQVDPAMPLTPLLLARILEQGYLRQKADLLRSRRLFLLLNQADTPGRRLAALRIARYFSVNSGEAREKESKIKNARETAALSQAPSFSAIWLSSNRGS